MKRRILVIDDEQNMRELMAIILGDAGYEVLTATNGEEGLAQIGNPQVDVVVTDLLLPGMDGEELLSRIRQERPEIPVVVVTAHGTISRAVQCIREGATDFITKPFEPEQLEIAVLNALKLRDVIRENNQLRTAVAQGEATRRLLGEGAAMRALHEEIRRVAPFKTNVLIVGESGTGKELIAREIHGLSPRRDKPWVAVNCAAIPHDLMESEMFGHVRGAFSGAVRSRAGRFEEAQGGTLFLDEIGDLDLGLQAKLLRVLQEREYSPVGSDEVYSLDVRVIAATHRDLRQLVAQGKFREDLLYRLEVYRIVAPPLRAHPEDIPMLVRAFLHDLGIETGKRGMTISDEAMAMLQQHAWAGNVRELRNAIERALLYCPGDRIDVTDFSLPATERAEQSVMGPVGFPNGMNLDEWLENSEKVAILNALSACGGVQSQAARLLQISERSLWHRLKKHGIIVRRSAGIEEADT